MFPRLTPTQETAIASRSTTITARMLKDVWNSSIWDARDDVPMLLAEIKALRADLNASVATPRNEKI